MANFQINKPNMKSQNTITFLLISLSHYGHNTFNHTFNQMRIVNEDYDAQDNNRFNLRAV